MAARVKAGLVSEADLVPPAAPAEAATEEVAIA
jgi:hypothetical protein